MLKSNLPIPDPAVNGPIGPVTLGTRYGLRMGLAALSTLVFYAAFFCCDFSFAHLARWNAAIFLRADADMVRLGFGA